MKKINFLKTTLVATTLVALTLNLGFTSCSDDDKDGTNPVNPETTLLPTKMIGEDDVFTFEYNDKKQLTQIKSTNISDPTDYTLSTITYADNGTISTLNEKEHYVTDAGKEYTYETNITYTYADGVITTSTTWVGSENKPMESKIFVNAAGYPTTTKQDEKDKEYTDFLSYDQYGNLTNWSEKYSYTQSETDDNDETTSWISNVYDNKHEAVYGTIYSPFISVNIPAWFFLTEQVDVSMNILATKHLTSSLKNIETKTATKLDADGQAIGEPVVSIEEQSEMLVNVTKEQDNYPIEIKVESERTGALTIEYKEVK